MGLSKDRLGGNLLWQHFGADECVLVACDHCLIIFRNWSNLAETRNSIRQTGLWEGGFEKD